MSGKKDIAKEEALDQKETEAHFEESHDHGKLEQQVGHLKNLPKKVIDKGSQRKHS